MIMELYDVLSYFDCQGAMMIYNGQMMPDAVKVAVKLGIQLIYLDQHQLDQTLPEVVSDETAVAFNTLWQEIRQFEEKDNHQQSRYELQHSKSHRW